MIGGIKRRFWFILDDFWGWLIILVSCDKDKEVFWSVC